MTTTSAVARGGVESPASSAVYRGWIRHRRKAPVAHEFTYPLFMVLLDIDAIPQLMQVSRLTSVNRWNWATFADRDHLDRQRGCLRTRLRDDAAAHGISVPDGPVFLLTHLRYLGYAFNPVSFYYCFDGEQRLRYVMAEVANTFGGRHHYWLERDAHQAGDLPPDEAPALRATATAFRATTSKALYVSPFMPDAVDYRFAFTRPEERLVVHMSVAGPDVKQPFDATLSLQRRPWSAAEIRGALTRFPWMSARVIAAIHWQALCLWAKRVPLVPRAHPSGLFGSSSIEERAE